MHLEFIFVYGMRNGSNFTFFTMVGHCPNAIYYIKKAIFSSVLRYYFYFILYFYM